jgi:hypothetical protein
MFSYDEVYDRLFESEKFINVLYKFHSSSWDNLDKNQRIALLQEFIDVYCDVLDIEELKLKSSKNKFSAGYYGDLKLILNINEASVENVSQYDILDTLFHELRHNFQRRAISKNLSQYEMVKEERVKEWKLNLLVSPRGYGNYINPEDENGHLYYFQPVEEDAFKTGFSLTKKSYSIIKEKLGEDKAFARYAQPFKFLIMCYFSNEEKYVARRKECQQKVQELFLKNNGELHIEKKCLNVANEIMKKKICDMTIEEIISLFSVYVWAYLDDDYKLDLLREYDKRVNKYKKVKIAKESNTAFKVNGKVCLREDICNILNELFSYEFKVMVQNIIDGKEPCDPKLREELMLNLYEVDGKRVNFVNDQNNFILYSIQPFALFEDKIVIEWFKKIKEVEEKIYGIKSTNYDQSIDYYDSGKYIPFIEQFYDEPFDKIYSDLIDAMKKKINNYKRS